MQRLALQAVEELINDSDTTEQEQQKEPEIRERAVSLYEQMGERRFAVTSGAVNLEQMEKLREKQVVQASLEALKQDAKIYDSNQLEVYVLLNNCLQDLYKDPTINRVLCTLFYVKSASDLKVYSKLSQYVSQYKTLKSLSSNKLTFVKSLYGLMAFSPLVQIFEYHRCFDQFDKVFLSAINQLEYYQLDE